MILDRILETEIFIMCRISNSVTDSGPELDSFENDEGADKGFQLRTKFVDSADKKAYSRKRALKFKRVGHFWPIFHNFRHFSSNFSNFWTFFLSNLVYFGQFYGNFELAAKF